MIFLNQTLFLSLPVPLPLIFALRISFGMDHVMALVRIQAGEIKMRIEQQ